MDASTSLSMPDPDDPFNKANVVLGEDEKALNGEFEKIGKLALMGFGVEPGMADWYCRYAADHLFDEIDEIGIRDGANLEIPGFKGISFGFSIWMTIEECTNPAVVWERERGFYTVPPLSDPEPFYLPEGIGWVDCAHVEHEEVIHVGWSEKLLKGVKKATFKYALGQEFIDAMEVFKSVNMHKVQPITVKGVEVRPRDVIEAAAPDPNEIGKRYVGQTCAGTWVKGRKDGLERSCYLYQVADNQESVGAVRHPGRRGADRVPGRDRARAAGRPASSPATRATPRPASTRRRRSAATTSCACRRSTASPAACSRWTPSTSAPATTRRSSSRVVTMWERVPLRSRRPQRHPGGRAGGAPSGRRPPPFCPRRLRLVRQWHVAAVGHAHGGRNPASRASARPSA